MFRSSNLTSCPKKHKIQLTNSRNVSPSSISSATLVGFGLLKYRFYSQQEGFYRVPLPAARQTSNLEDQWLLTFHLPPSGVPHVWNDASEPQQRKVEVWARNCREFCRKWRLPRHFCVLLHAVHLRHGTDGFTSPPNEGALRIFSREVELWTRNFREFCRKWRFPRQF